MTPELQITDTNLDEVIDLILNRYRQCKLSYSSFERVGSTILFDSKEEIKNFIIEHNVYFAIFINPKTKDVVGTYMSDAFLTLFKKSSV